MAMNLKQLWNKRTIRAFTPRKQWKNPFLRRQSVCAVSRASLFQVNCSLIFVNLLHAIRLLDINSNNKSTDDEIFLLTHEQLEVGCKQHKMNAQKAKNHLTTLLESCWPVCVLLTQIPPYNRHHVFFTASSLWNTFRTLPEGREIRDFTVEISFLKS